jgi:hypothetical protein
MKKGKESKKPAVSGAPLPTKQELIERAANNLSSKKKKKIPKRSIREKSGASGRKILRGRG